MTKVKYLHPESDFAVEVELIARDSRETMAALPSYDLQLEFRTGDDGPAVIASYIAGQLTGCIWDNEKTRLVVKADRPGWSSGALRWRMCINPRDAGFPDNHWAVVREGWCHCSVRRTPLFGSPTEMLSVETDALQLSFIVPDFLYIMTVGDKKVLTSDGTTPFKV